MGIIIRALFVLGASMVCFSTAWASRLETLKIYNQDNKIVVLGQIAGSSNYKAFTLHTPERVVIDLNQTSINPSINLNRLIQGHNSIKSVRIGHPDSHTLRLVFDITKPLNLNTMAWHPGVANRTGFKMVIAPVNGVSEGHATIYNSAPPLTAHPMPIKKPVYIAHPHMRASRDVVVVIDPGHGGYDPGAIGMHRSAEKHVVLAIAVKLKRLIDRQPGMRAVLTRNGDYYVGLRERMSIARKYNGDIFVAIHADAFGNHNSHGASVFALSQTGATSEAARWLAEKENHSELGGVNLSDLDDQNGVIRTVLIDLSQTATISSSLHMGSQVLHGLNQITTLHSRKVEQARFMVLKSPDIPSVLIETGFISNPAEERNLTSPTYQARLSEAIFSGIKRYFQDYPPNGSRIEAIYGANKPLNNSHRWFSRRSKG